MNRTKVPREINVKGLEEVMTLKMTHNKPSGNVVSGVETRDNAGKETGLYSPKIVALILSSLRRSILIINELHTVP